MGSPQLLSVMTKVPVGSLAAWVGQVREPKGTEFEVDPGLEQEING